MKVTWRDLKERFFGESAADHFMNKLWNEIKKYYSIDSWRNNLRTYYHAFRMTQSHLDLDRFLSAAAYGGFLYFCVFYGMIKIFNVFELPLITLWLTHDSLSMHQICFNSAYFGLLIVICYRLWILIRYEITMWYIVPDLCDLRLSRNVLNDFYAYYNYIQKDMYLIKDAVSGYVGKDVADIIMLYTPDYISSYNEPVELSSVVIVP